MPVYSVPSMSIVMGVMLCGTDSPEVSDDAVGMVDARGDAVEKAARLGMTSDCSGAHAVSAATTSAEQAAAERRRFIDRSPLTV
ncbi:hypothetical protein GCM10009775_08990 [Microbacterium aoyamense]|uniref:Secreted protein n=1 Tax=Microbacterium aoyamense TaxID=344166 RepID=A0ABN2PCZ6_9MICO